MTCNRVTIDRDPFPSSIDHDAYNPRSESAQWVWAPGTHLDEPSVVFFRCEVNLADAESFMLHVSADNRYELFIDGERVGRGPSRGDRYHWCFETFEMELAAGRHVFSARVWWLPDQGSPMAQFLVAPGFMVYAEGSLHDALSTGHGPWRCLKCEAYSQNERHPGECLFTGWAFHLDATRYPWGWQEGKGTGWIEPVSLERVSGQRRSPYAGNESDSRWGLHHLIADTLPPMMEVEQHVGRVRFAAPSADTEGRVLQSENDADLVAAVQRMLDGKGAVTIEPNTSWRVIIDLDDYYCAFPELSVSGGLGGVIDLAWAESLYVAPDERAYDKGNRDQVFEKYYRGPADRFVLDGGARTFDTLWWRAGRYLQLRVLAGNKPITLESLLLRETRYPLERESELETDDPCLASIEPMMMRALQMCSHETFMDCPYYEQLMYVGDTRLEVLSTYVTTFDTRLPHRAIDLFDWSRAADGLTKSRYPSQALQVIPPFSLWWVSMVHDYFMWRDPDVTAWIPGINAVLEAFEQYLNNDGLVEDPKGWNFCDWVPGWAGGVPPSGHGGVSCLLSLQYLYALDRASEMLVYSGKPNQAAHWAAVAKDLRKATISGFWSEQRGLLADDQSLESYSEHCQALAILCDLVSGAQRDRMISGFLHDSDLARCTIYFSHYSLEAYARIDAMDAFWHRLETWFDLARLGFKTTREMPEPSRSDCHAWGAHPLYHFYATLAGIRPSKPGFAEVRIEPHMGPLKHIKGTLPHPSGEMITFEFKQGGDKGVQNIGLPRGIKGVYVRPNGGMVEI